MNGVTADFVESFENAPDADLRGIFWWLILDGIAARNPDFIPEGLDVCEPRVIAICERAAALRAAEKIADNGA